MLYMVTFTISIPQTLAYIPYMDPMGYSFVVCLERKPSFLGRSTLLTAAQLFGAAGARCVMSALALQRILLRTTPGNRSIERE